MERIVNYGSLLLLSLIWMTWLLFARSDLIKNDKHVTLGEELFIRPLRSGHISANFLFSSEWKPTEEDRCNTHEKGSLDPTLNGSPNDGTNTLCHFGIFPHAIGEIIDRFQVEELEVRFTRGRWDLAKWGPDPLIAGAGGPDGVEVWVKFFAGSEGVEEPTGWRQWVGLTKALGGLFCASLERLDLTRSFQPGLAHFGRSAGFRRVSGEGEEGDCAANSSNIDAGIWHGMLPREAVCTENLTPWTKLLPCRDMAGLASLLRPTRIFASDFHSLSIGINVQRNPEGQAIETILLEQKLMAVFPPGKKMEFSLSSLLGPAKAQSKQSKGTELPRVVTACPLVQTSAIHTILPSWLAQSNSSEMSAKYEFKVPPTATQAIASGWHPNLDHPDKALQVATHLVPKTAADGLKTKVFWMKWPAVISPAERPPQLVQLDRYVSGQGGMNAVLNTKITNNAACNVIMQYSDAMPKFVLPFFNTMTFKVYTNNTFADYEPENLSFDLNEAPHLSFLEMDIVIPPYSSVLMSLEITKKFLHVDEFPPDASRGLDFHPGIATFKLQCEWESDPHVDDPTSFISQSLGKYFAGEDSTVRLYSEACLTYLPEPDFSMPFNVITLNCTLIALFIGTMLNLLVRKSDVINPDKGRSNRRNKLNDKIKAAVHKFKKVLGFSVKTS